MLEGMKPTVYVPTCRVRTVLDQLDENDRKALEDYLTDENWLAHRLSQALRDRGVRISPNPITRHRRGQCSC